MKTQQLLFGIALSVALPFALGGCELKVEDDNNDRTAAALEEQNDILEANKTPISLFGSIVDAGTAMPVSSAIVTVRVGATWRDPVETSGSFTVASLPANTDVVIVIESPTDEFMKRAFFGKTTYVDAGQLAEQSVGDLPVSRPQTKTYSVLNAEDESTFPGLVFKYNTATAFSYDTPSAGFNEYEVVSSYDESTGQYTIEIPQDLNFTLSASGDIDGDGIPDYSTEDSDFSNGNQGGVLLYAEEAKQLEVLYVTETPEYQPVELRISIIDKFGEPIDGAEINASDRFRGKFETGFDETSQEYTFDYQSSSMIELMVPAFTSGAGIHYQSGYLRLNWATSDTLSIYESGFVNNLPNQVAVSNGMAHITVLPTEAYIGNAYVNYVSSQINPNDNYSLSRFYESPVGLVDGSVTFKQLDVLQVIKGNASENDLVPVGSTQISFADLDIPVSVTLKHNNTFLVARPESNPGSGHYSYTVNQLLNEESGSTFTDGDSQTFQIPASEAETGTFDISDVKLDNNNGTLRGSPIVAQNTAGEASTATNSRRDAYLYLPESIITLDYLRLDLVEVTESGNSYPGNTSLVIIENGELNYYDSQYLVSLATNENIFYGSGGYNYPNVDSYTSLTDGRRYKIYAYIYSRDNTNGDKNNATINYIYRVKGEDTVHSGSITLPVR